MKRITCLGFFAAIFMLAGSANALSFEFDFRTAEWAPADGLSVFASAPVTVSAFNGAVPALLFQDSTDGLGVKGGEPDEIDKAEWLIVEFDSPRDVWDVYITDLFAPLDGDNNIYGERGTVELYGGGSTLLTSFQFDGISADQGNGELLVDFGATWQVSYLKFYADTVSFRNNEFSVAGLNSSEVPEPATMLLFGTGLAGLAGALRRKKGLKS